jgi:hypothetical protein
VNLKDPSGNFVEMNEAQVEQTVTSMEGSSMPGPPRLGLGTLFKRAFGAFALSVAPNEMGDGSLTGFQRNIWNGALREGVILTQTELDAGITFQGYDSYGRARLVNAITGEVMFRRATGKLDDQVADSSLLAANLQANGAVRPQGWHAHHIVPGGDDRAAYARSVLARFGIGINDPANGVFLPGGSRTQNPGGSAIHSRLHTNDYMRYVEDRMRNAVSYNSAIAALQDIRTALQDGNWP